MSLRHELDALLLLQPGAPVLPPGDVLLQYCYECDALAVGRVPTPAEESCVHSLRYRPQVLETADRMRGLWREPTNFTVNPAETVHSRPASPVAGGIAAQAPPLPQAPWNIALPESDEESYGEEKEEEAEAYTVEPTEATDQVEGDDEEWGALPAVFRTRAGRRALFRNGRYPPPTTTDGLSTRASSEAVRKEEGDDVEDAGDSESGSAWGEIEPSEGEDLGTPATRRREGLNKTGAREEAETEAEDDGGDEDSLPLGSRSRPRRPVGPRRTKRRKPTERASAEDAAGYPTPQAVYQEVLRMAKFDINIVDEMFPVDQRACVANRGVGKKENWECRLKLGITHGGEACWAYNQDQCLLGGYNRDGYIRHLFEGHLAVQRASGGKTRADQIRKALGRCVSPPKGARGGKRAVEESDEESQPGPSRKRMRIK